MTDISVGPPVDDAELQDWIAQHRRTYNASEDDAQRWLEWIPTEHLRFVRRGSKVCGSLLLLDMGQWFSGRSVPMTGINSVGIDPQERATGLASELMRSAVLELRERGVALSTLYPATQPVYRRVGYELAGSWTGYKLDTAKIDVRDRELDISLTDDREAMKAIETERARRSAGLLDRSDHIWKRLLDRPKTDIHAYLAGDEGYVVFKQTDRTGEMGYTIDVRDLVALTPRAARRLLTFFADHRSFAPEVYWFGAPNDPLLYHLREQDWKVDQTWTWMLRVVDVPKALEARGYPARFSADIHLEVSDDLIASNDGRFVLEVAGGRGEVREGGEGRVRLDVRGLAPLYTGYLSAEELTATGLADGGTDDLAIASAAFAGPAPWLADFF